jgi:hypothetical protein
MVNTWPGWETRSRSSGGYDGVWGIGVHHDAIRTGVPLLTRCTNAWNTAADRPIGALWLHTDGLWMVGAAGATNTQGKGGPYRTSKGVIPLDQGNRYMLSIEASNNGVGEVWPEVMQDSYVRGCAALCKWLGLNPLTDVIAHFEWTTRKIDPAGPSRYAAGANKWNMPAFRSDVAKIGAPPPPPPTQPIPVIPGVPDVFQPIAPFRNSDTRGFGGPGMAPMTPMQFGVNPAVIPSTAIAVAMNVTIVGPKAPGYVTVWPGGPMPNASAVNFPGDGGAHNGAVVIGLSGGSFQVMVSTQAHVICDITGYWTA